MSRKTLAIIGGGLQGTEAAYLARKAGWRVLLMDKNPHCPASGLCDTVLAADITRKDQLLQIQGQADCVLPALENDQALGALAHWGPQLKIPVIFDFDAYAVSSSKKVSNTLFAELNLPCPRSWPACGLPVLAKPVSASGSENVQIVNTHQDIERLFQEHRQDEWILEEYIPGPSYSLEVLAWKGTGSSLTVTDLGMDDRHDCCRVTAPTVLSPLGVAQFRSIAEQIAKALSLSGIMDVEVIAGPSGLKLLEIDARLPSQTPTAVYWSTGVNMLADLLAMFLTGTHQVSPPSTDQAVIYEHILVTPAGLATKGEHIMAEAGPLQLRSGFFGADEAITDYQPGQSTWAATLIISGRTIDAAWRKRNRVLDLIEKNRTCAVSR
mgnify:FL=1